MIAVLNEDSTDSSSVSESSQSRSSLGASGSFGSYSASSPSSFSLRPTKLFRQMSSRFHGERIQEHRTSGSVSHIADVLGHLQFSDGSEDEQFSCPSPVSLRGLFTAFLDLFEQSKISLLESELKSFFSVYPIFVSPTEFLVFLMSQLRDSAVVPIQLNMLSENTRNTETGPTSFYKFTILLWLEYDARAASLCSELQDELRHIEVLPPHTRADIEHAIYLASIQPPPSPRLLPHFDPPLRASITKAFWLLAPKHAAQHLANAHFVHLRNVRPWDLLQHNSTHDNKRCREVSNHFNNIVSWVASSIVKCSSSRSRARRISSWIKIAEAAREANFLSVLLMLTNGLDHFTISRLKKTWLEVPQSHRDLLRDLLAYCAPASNFKHLREASRRSGHPLPLAVILKDILFIYEVLPTVPTQDDLIAYDRFSLLGKTLTCQTNYERTVFNPSSSISNSHLSDFLLNPVPRYSEDKLFALSLALESSRLTPTTDAETPVLVENALLKSAPPSPVSRRLLFPSSPSSSSSSSPSPLSTSAPIFPTPSAALQTPRSSSASASMPSLPPLITAESPPTSPVIETRSENRLYQLLERQRQLQQNLLPSVAAQTPEPKRKRTKIARVLGKLA